MTTPTLTRSLLSTLRSAAAGCAVLAAPVLLLGCPPDGGGSGGDGEVSTVTDDDADAYDAGAEGDAHAHTAMYGGHLVEVGEHNYSLELVPGDGKVDVYVMDAHHENPVLVGADDIEFELDTPDGEEIELEGEAVEANAEGLASHYVYTVPEGVVIMEKHGDHFDMVSEGHFHLTVDGTEYEGMLSDDHDHDHDHGDEVMVIEGGSAEAGSL